jgi:mycothiol synthase
MNITRLDHGSFDWRSGAGGAEDVRRIAAAAEAADGRSSLNEAAVLSLRNHGLETGVLLTAGTGGDPQGFAYLHGLSGAGRPEVDLVVHPDVRGRGVGTALARAILDTSDGIPITAWSHGNHPAAASLAATVGLTSVRELWLMRREAAAPLPSASVPPGYGLRTFVAGEDDLGFLAVNAAAFSAHPEQGTLDLAGLRERMAEDWFDPQGFLVAEKDGRIVGFHWTKVHPATAGAPGFGEVYVIGVHPSTQGSGLGKALLVAGLDHLGSLGLEQVVLYVEGENTGAVRLYESFGFTHAPADTDVMYASP